MSADHESQENPSIPKEIWGLSLGNFFVNISSVMVRSVFPVYLKTVLGVGAGWIGLVEGLVEGLSFIIKMMSGVYSDYLQRRKFIIVLGYTLMALSRPIFACFSTVQAVVIARVLDRMGNGIQASPRDALVGDLAPKKIRGACYGMRVGLGTAGSFVGALVSLLLMYMHNENFQLVFWISVIPGLIAIALMVSVVREPEKRVLAPATNDTSESSCGKNVRRHPIHMSDIPRLGKRYWMVMVIVATFMIAQLGEPILVLHAHENFGLTGAYVPLVLLTFNSTYSSVSYPAGKLSDRIGRHNTLMIGFLCLIFGDLFMATAQNILFVFVGIAFCGAQMAITQSIFMTLIADSVPEDLRGTGFGIFYLICALCALISNSGSGYISELYGQEVAFTISMGIASLSLGLLFLVRPKKVIRKVAA